jgi:fluoroquinolone transport system ATP-binding protein
MITVEGLTFGYTKTPFLKNISFAVPKGQIFGFLGPSGAGKSTLQKVLIGMLPRYGGQVSVLGSEPRSATSAFYEQIGIAFEFPTLYEKLTGRQNLSFFASLYQKPARDIGALLRAVGLSASADQRVGEYSKGMKGRLNFIKALLHDPALLFLDEPTSGLDPTNAQVIKQMILAEKAKGKTIILTTHNMADAAELCDRVAFIVDGEMRAVDTPRNFIMGKSAGDVSYTWQENGAERTGACPLGETGGDARLLRLMSENRLTTIHSHEQTLGDVFMDITGRVLA